MIPHSNKLIMAAFLFIFFSVAASVSARGQVTAGRIGQGRRVGKVVLPTPPFNPDAGILTRPKTRSSSTSTKPAPHRTTNRRVRAGNRNPRPRTPRKRRVPQGRQRR